MAEIKWNLVKSERLKKVKGRRRLAAPPPARVMNPRAGTAATSRLEAAALAAVRGISFEEIIQAKLIAIKKHPGREHQNVMLFEYRGYIWVVPYVMDGEDIFLKTLYPSRKYTRLYKRGETL